MRISVGRGGTLQLATVPAVAYVATAARWHKNDALKLVNLYKKAGFVHLVRSKDYKKATNLMTQAIQDTVRTGKGKSSQTSVAHIIPKCWAELTEEHEVVREVTQSMLQIFFKVDQEAEQIRRLPGRVVRFEGGNALVTINSGDKEELRLVDSSYLKSAGIQDDGTLFVLHEYKWSPDSTMSLFFPAVDLSYDAEEEKAALARLKEADHKVLPAPPEGLFRPDFVPEEETTASHAESPAQEIAEATEAPSRAANSR
jgi:hypothetical protein